MTQTESAQGIVPEPPATPGDLVISVRRIHRRDLNRVWEFLKLVFRGVNRETVEYQRPRSKKRFEEVYEEDGIEQLVFEVKPLDGASHIVGYAECAFEITGSDNWMNERYFDRRDMRPLFVEELAVHPEYQGRGIGAFLLEQLEHLARVRGCTHLVLEVAENNTGALKFYRARSFYRLDAAIFLAKKVPVESELLPPRRLKKKQRAGGTRALSANEANVPVAARRRSGAAPPAEPSRTKRASVSSRRRSTPPPARPKSPKAKSAPVVVPDASPPRPESKG